MPKTKKLFLVVLFTLFVSDICKYIKMVIHSVANRVISFDIVITRFQNGFVINKAIIFLLSISVIYFMTHFFQNDNE